MRLDVVSFGKAAFQKPIRTSPIVILRRPGFVRARKGMVSQSSHRKCMKTAENKGFLTTPSAMGRSEAVKSTVDYEKANKINGYMHVSYGTALAWFYFSSRYNLLTIDSPC